MNRRTGLSTFALLAALLAAIVSPAAGCQPSSDAACTDATQCPATGAECVLAACGADGTCGTANVADLTPTAAGQVPGDCKVRVCDGAGGERLVNDDADLPAPSDDCHVGACEAGAPSQSPAALGTACAFAGGLVCDAAGACVECNGDGDCTDPTRPVCDPAAHTCVSDLCANLTQDGNESDVDCGGSCGSTCLPGKGCNAGYDCLSHVCTGTCQAPACNDTVQNGSETDVDCGGSCGPTCPSGDRCGGAADCLSGVCRDGTCQPPACDDAVRNGDETDVDCGGSCVGAPANRTCGVSQACARGSDCVTGFCGASSTCAYKVQGAPCGSHDECGAAGSNLCVDGVCCGSVCGALCQACSAAKKGSGPDGVCGNIALGADPDTECSAQSAATCGNSGGGCDGGGACRKYPAGTLCRAAAGLCDAAEACAGNGAACPADGFLSNATLCRASTGACDPAEFCTGTSASCPSNACGAACGGCSIGDPCGVDADCASGMCYGGLCVAGVNGCSVATATDLTASSPNAISFANFAYSPRCIKVSAGSAVQFDGDFSLHPLLGGEVSGGTAFPAASGPFLPVTNSGTTRTFTLSSPGTFPYYCTAHYPAGMFGAVFVVP